MLFVDGLLYSLTYWVLWTRLFKLKLIFTSYVDDQYVLKRLLPNSIEVLISLVPYRGFHCVILANQQKTRRVYQSNKFSTLDFSFSRKRRKKIIYAISYNSR